MQRRLLCLLTGQPIPQLLTVRHLLCGEGLDEPPMLLLGVTPAMRASYKSFMEALAVEPNPFTGQKVMLELANDALPAEVHRSLKEQVEEWCEGPGEWLVAMTGGTRLMAMGLERLARELGARMLYIDQSRPMELLDVETGARETIAHQLSLPEFFLAHGFDVRMPKVSRKMLARERAARICVLRREPITYKNTNSNDDCSNARKRLREGREPDTAIVAVNDADLREALLEAFPEVVWNGPYLAGGFSRELGEFLTGGWLETFLFCLMARNQEALSIRDVRMNVTFQARDTRVKNEIDICFMRGSYLHAIECKTGMPASRTAVDSLYKIESVIHQTRAMHTRASLVTTHPNVYVEQNGRPIPPNVKPELRERAAFNNWRLVAPHQLDQLAQCRSIDEEVSHLTQMLFG
jgi:hypothetical protein